ncbi:hypothetical protein ABZ516_11925 [Streptomyces sp. NPDC019826]
MEQGADPEAMLAGRLLEHRMAECEDQVKTRRRVVLRLPAP